MTKKTNKTKKDKTIGGESSETHSAPPVRRNHHHQEEFDVLDYISDYKSDPEDKAVERIPNHHLEIRQRRAIVMPKNQLFMRYIEVCKQYQEAPYPAIAIALHYPYTHYLHLGRSFTLGMLLPLAEVINDPDCEITTLDFSHCCRINSVACSVLRHILSHNTKITNLNLSNNKINDIGAQMLSEGLKENKSLKELNLRNNHLGSEGAPWIAQLIRGNNALKHLDISNNQIGVEGVNLIDHAVASSSCLKEVLSGGNFVLEEILNSVTHGVGILFSIVGGYMLVSKHYDAGQPQTVLAMFLYMMSMFLLFSASTLAHSFFLLEPRSKLYKTFWILDHSCISMLIAGSYTPFALVTFSHIYMGSVIAAVIWLLACLSQYFAFTGKNFFNLILFLTMGWVGILPAPWIYVCFEPQAIVLVLLGGLSYTGGVYFYLKGKIYPLYHAVWHVFVLVGAIFHYFCIYFYCQQCSVAPVDPDAWIPIPPSFA